MCSDDDSPVTTFRLAPHVRLRREHFGGLVFDRSTGDALELDRSVFRLLELAVHGIGTREARGTIEKEKIEHRLLRVDPQTPAPVVADHAIALAELDAIS